ncbi:MAG: glycoside hydrolase family 28 protein, partial [Muribaculaceae bacterium]|nr:glycoside hydrolase family 28 protein [Muribaculaceae bacterium]
MHCVLATALANDVNVLDFGAKGDGIADDAAAIQNAIDACSGSGGGTVLFPAGHTYLAGPIHLKSDIDLHLQPNATLLASPDESIYRESAFLANEGEGMIWISGTDLKNVSISGTGRIDGNAVAFMGAE